ncbi:MAG: hypothetical protein K2J74_04375 [Muribaculaceae bacterium]|nr:hypothetical protein [Muribaculaceae bacterium]
MVYKFNIVTDEVDDFKLTIEIDADDTFLSLRNAILKAVGYTNDQMDSFFICDDDWSKSTEITLMDMGSESDEDVWTMGETRLNDLIEDDGQKLLFVFDYLSDRAFFMEMKESIPGKDIKEPKVLHIEGKVGPQFIDFDELEAKNPIVNNAIFDGDEDFYGDSAYNDDEFDSDSYLNLDDLGDL